MNYKWSANGRQMRGYVEQIQAKVCSKREAMSEKRPVFGGGAKRLPSHRFCHRHQLGHKTVYPRKRLQASRVELFALVALGIRPSRFGLARTQTNGKEFAHFKG